MSPQTRKVLGEFMRDATDEALVSAIWEVLHERRKFRAALVEMRSKMDDASRIARLASEPVKRVKI